MTRCLAPDCRMGGVGCDNMTVIIVCLLQGEDYSELINKCAHLSTSASGNSVRERSINKALDVDEDTDEWYDCADELLTVSADNGTSCSIKTAEVVKQEEEMREEEEDAEVRQGDDTVWCGDEETRQEEHFDNMETAQAHVNSDEAEADTTTSQSSSVDKEDVSGHNSLFTNGHHDNQAKDTISQTNSLLDGGQIYKSTAV